ncbi:MAG: hypothetical protein ACLVHQ_02095 [Oscillospiraceae bacterium]
MDSVKSKFKLFVGIFGCGVSVNSNLKLFVGIFDCGFSVKLNLKLFARILGCGFSVKSKFKLFVGILGCGFSVKPNLKVFARILGCGFSVKSKIKLFVGILGCGFSVKSKFSETQAPCGLNMDCCPAGKNSPQKKKLELFLQAGSPLSGCFFQKKRAAAMRPKKSFSPLNLSMSEERIKRWTLRYAAARSPYL